jgi:hypothetical protein
MTTDVFFDYSRKSIAGVLVSMRELSIPLSCLLDAHIARIARLGLRVGSGILGLFLLLSAPSAMASPALALLPQGVVATAAASVSLSSSCLRVTYDQNGNRLTRSTAMIVTSTSSWGAATYGCNTWG